jgi:N-acetylmuramoyl-L-alanine amidase
VDTVLLHHTGTDSAGRWSDRSALNTLTNPASGVSAHYTVTTDGKVYRHVPESLKAWHAGKGRLPWETCPEYDFNHRSIGIEIVNPGDGKTPFTEAQYRALGWLVPDIVSRMGHVVPCMLSSLGGKPWAEQVCRTGGARPPAYILGHRDITDRKTDPADNFDWSMVREALAGCAA